MKRVLLLVMTLSMLTGAWQSSMAQAAKTGKPAKSKATDTKPAEPRAPTETASAPVIASDTAPAAESTAADITPHKKKGLFGKAKSVMSNKVVKTVAKVAACTMVPGGQAIAGAIDAASSNSAGEAAAGAAGAATGSSCMPGMGGAGMAGAGMTGASMAGAGMAGGVGGGAAGLVGAGLAGVAAGAMPTGTAAYAPPMGYGPDMEGYGDPKPMADCMGITVEEFNAMTNPTGGVPRQATKAEMKRAQQLSKKVGSQRQMTCSQTVGMQQANVQMAQMQQMMAVAQARMPAAGSGGTTTEAPGETIALAPDLGAELAKGKTVVRRIDWVAGSADVSPAGEAGFQQAMATLGQAIKASGQRYRIDLYMDQRYDDAAVQTYGPARQQLVASTLAGAIGDPGTVQSGKAKRDKNPRLELVKVK